MMPEALRKEGRLGIDTRPLAGLSDDEKRANEKWRRGGFLGKDELVLAFLILGIIVMAFLATLAVLSACPLPQSGQCQMIIRPFDT